MKNQTTRKRLADPSWDTKDDAKRRNWKDQEVMAMLNLIKKHNLLDHVPTDAQLGETLLKPMTNLGYIRTAHQIKLKIKSLRKSYIHCRKNDLNSLKKYSFYDLLDSLYSHAEAKDSESEDDSCENEDNSNVWAESEVSRLLLVIKQTDLGKDLSVGNIPLKALRQIHKSLQNFNVNKSLDQIKTLLLSLRNTYANYKKDLANGSTEEIYPYLEQLDSLWKREYANGNFHFANGYDEFWSEEETILLLEALKEIDVSDVDNSNSDFVTSKVQEFLSDSGYKRTKFQILKRIENLKQNYTIAKQCTNLDEAIAKFPFYHRFENVFKISRDMEIKEHFKEEESDNQDKFEFEDLIVLEKKKHCRGFIWVEEEVSTLLRLVKEMNLMSMFRGRMTLDYVSQLVAPMATRGFERTAGQIKIKLKGLRNQYYRCVNNDLSDKSLSECPYFEKIHEMVQMLDQSCQNIMPQWKQTANRSSKVKKKDILKEIEVDEHDQNFISGLNVTAVNHRDNSKLKKDEIVLWKPLETIPDEDDYEATVEHEIVENEEDRLSEMFEEVSEDEADNTAFSVVNDCQIIEVSNENDSQEDYVEYTDLTFSEAEQAVDIDTTTSASGNIQILAERSVDSEESDNVPIHVNISENLFDKDNYKIENDLEFKHQDFTKSKSTKDILTQVLKHEELLQKQHHLWLEKQFEIQRKHDHEQRAELLNELRKLRCAITSTVLHRKSYEEK